MTDQNMPVVAEPAFTTSEDVDAMTRGIDDITHVIRRLHGDLHNAHFDMVSARNTAPPGGKRSAYRNALQDAETVLIRLNAARGSLRMLYHAVRQTEAFNAGGEPRNSFGPREPTT